MVRLEQALAAIKVRSPRHDAFTVNTMAHNTMQLIYFLPVVCV